MFFSEKTLISHFMFVQVITSACKCGILPIFLLNSWFIFKLFLQIVEILFISSTFDL